MTLVDKLEVFFLLIILVTNSFIKGTVKATEICNDSHPFKCNSSKGCILRNKFCDFTEDCSDGSDEILYNKTLHQDIGIECLVRNPMTGRVKPCFLPNQYRCDHELDCTLGEDECDCDTTMQCDSSPFALRDKQCILRSRFCDNVQHCYDNSDEIPHSPDAEGFHCAVTKTRVTSHCMLSHPYVCDGISDCDDAVDECFCTAPGSGVNTNGNATASPDTSYRFLSKEFEFKEMTHGLLNSRIWTGNAVDNSRPNSWYNSWPTLDQQAFLNEHCFRCLDDSKVIPGRQFCDKIFHCQDLTDECLCTEKPKICDQICKVGKDCGPCVVGQLMCERENPKSNIECVNRTEVCDGKSQCPLYDDESNCDVDFSNFFNCTDGSQYIPKHQLCDNNNDCENQSDEENCSDKFFQCSAYYMLPPAGKQTRYDFGRPRYAVACDKIPTCEDLEDECNETMCGTPLPEYCANVQGINGYVCPHSKLSILGTEVCDGFPTCLHYFNHTAHDERDCPFRFYCHDQGQESLPIHIPLSSVCNKLSDCHDGSDERNCSLDTHFYCKSNLPTFLLKDKVCNGIQDCSDGEDECQDCFSSPISSDRFLVNSYVLQGLIWIVASLAVFGNLGVICHNLKQFLCKPSSRSIVTHNHRVLVINLAVADLLLGIYLVDLAIVNEHYRGIYCRKDIQWRSSSYCAAMGCLAVISVTCSTLTLLIMASMRLYLTLRPFTTSRVHRRYILLAIAFAWILSLIIALVPCLVPLNETLMDYFLSEVRYKNNQFLTLANRHKLKEFVKSLWTFQDNTNATFTKNLDRTFSWRNMIEAVSRLNETYRPDLYFGYYSAHGVCLPRIFPVPSIDRSWGFSLMTMIFIFVSFLYIVCVYVTIYKTTVDNTRQSGMTGDDEINKILQRKLSRIMLTNLCCWIPICVMAFMSAGGYKLPEEAYAVSAIVLLPINSAFDPIIYSNFPELLWKNCFVGTRVEKWMEPKEQGL